MADPSTYWSPCPKCRNDDRAVVSWSEFRNERSKHGVPTQTARMQCKECGADYRTGVHAHG